MTAFTNSSRIQRGAYKADQNPQSVSEFGSANLVQKLKDEISILKATFQDELQNAISEREADFAARIEESFKRGFAEGKLEGIKQGRAEIAETEKAIPILLKEIENAVAEVWESSRKGIVQVVLAVSRKLVGEIAHNYENLAVDLTETCLKLVKEQSKVTIAVNPEDAEMLRSAAVDLRAQAEGVKHVEIVERSNISRGGVIVETNAGQFDARLEEQMAVVKSVLEPGWSKPENDTEEDDAYEDEVNGTNDEPDE